MPALVALDGQPGWVAALTPLSVDGMIVAASLTLLADSRSGGRGGALPWALLAIGSVASLAANVAVAEPTVTGRVIAARPSFALIGSYELLMRQVRTSAHGSGAVRRTSISSSQSQPVSFVMGTDSSAFCAALWCAAYGSGLKHQAWEWALADRSADGVLPSGNAIGDRFGRHERWGRLVKREGMASEIEAGIDAAARGHDPIVESLSRPSSQPAGGQFP